MWLLMAGLGSACLPVPRPGAPQGARNLPGHLLRVELFPYAPFAARIWDLRDNVTCYDAWHVALAEALNASLATLDARLARASGPRCRFLVTTP